MHMTPIQEFSIPPILKGKDILAQAKTGSGKTAAFSVGLLETLRVERFRVQNLVLCPTRELAEQVSEEMRRIARFRHNIKILTITGGIPHFKQEHSLHHQAHIVVGTPGRVLKLLKRGSLVPDELRAVVLDEADRMLDMGFIDEVDEILSFVPEKAQTLCFSATFPDEIRALSRRRQHNPREIVVETQHKKNVIDQHFFEIPGRGRGPAVIRLLETHRPESVLVFCNTKNACRRVAGDLENAGLSCLQLHGDLEQKERNETLIRFANGSSRILVATDVAARGLDIQDLGAVINYDLPFETENYIHRIGRTGRAGKTGQAFSLLKPGQRQRLDEINEYQDSRFGLENMDDYPASGMDEHSSFPEAEMMTLSINGGRKNKISAGDILGALTAQKGIDGSAIGKIDRMDFITFVAVRREAADKARKVLEQKPIKGRRFKVMRHD